MRRHGEAVPGAVEALQGLGRLEHRAAVLGFKALDGAARGEVGRLPDRRAGALQALKRPVHREVAAHRRLDGPQALIREYADAPRQPALAGAGPVERERGVDIARKQRLKRPGRREAGAGAGQRRWSLGPAFGEPLIEGAAAHGPADGREIAAELHPALRLRLQPPRSVDGGEFGPGAVDALQGVGRLDHGGPVLVGEAVERETGCEVGRMPDRFGAGLQALKPLVHREVAAHRRLDGARPSVLEHEPDAAFAPAPPGGVVERVRAGGGVFLRRCEAGAGSRPHWRRRRRAAGTPLVQLVRAYGLDKILHVLVEAAPAVRMAPPGAGLESEAVPSPVEALQGLGRLERGVPVRVAERAHLKTGPEVSRLPQSRVRALPPLSHGPVHGEVAAHQGVGLGELGCAARRADADAAGNPLFAASGGVERLRRVDQGMRRLFIIPPARRAGWHREERAGGHADFAGGTP